MINVNCNRFNGNPGVPSNAELAMLIEIGLLHLHDKDMKARNAASPILLYSNAFNPALTLLFHQLINR